MYISESALRVKLEYITNALPLNERFHCIYDLYTKFYREFRMDEHFSETYNTELVLNLYDDHRILYTKVLIRTTLDEMILLRSILPS